MQANSQRKGIFMLTRYRALYIATFAVVFIFSITAFLPDALAKPNKAPSIEEASAAVSKLDPTIKVLSVNPTLMPDLWEIVVELRTQQKVILYLNSAGTLVIQGSLIDINNRIDITKARMEDLNRVDFASIPVDNDLVLGNPSAKKKVVVFDDPE